MIPHEDQLAREQATLAPYALASSRSQGRRHTETRHSLRTEFQRDRDRIIHARAFRRLEYKTQVFVSGFNDHFRTRLTHTIEVAGIARTIARSLRLNEDLAETIALAHDLGHPPFGHCGEHVLNEILVDHSGFDHNEQALRVVDHLEEKYPDFPGLNLTWEVRTGLIKHRGRPHRDTLDGVALSPQPSLETQVADLADDLTYLTHDMDDAISGNLLTAKDLSELEIWQSALAHSGRQDIDPSDRRYASFMVRNVIDLLVGDAVRSSAEHIAAAQIDHPDAAQQLDIPLIHSSPGIRAQCATLKRYLFDNMYFHPKVLSDNEQAVEYMRQLFDFFLAHPDQLGSRARERQAEDGSYRAVADYIASMTDRYALQQYGELIEGRRPPTPGSGVPRT